MAIPSKRPYNIPQSFVPKKVVSYRPDTRTLGTAQAHRIRRITYGTNVDPDSGPEEFNGYEDESANHEPKYVGPHGREWRIFVGLGAQPYRCKFGQCDFGIRSSATATSSIRGAPLVYEFWDAHWSDPYRAMVAGGFSYQGIPGQIDVNNPTGSYGAAAVDEFGIPLYYRHPHLPFIGTGTQDDPIRSQSVTGAKYSFLKHYLLPPDTYGDGDGFGIGYNLGYFGLGPQWDNLQTTNVDPEWVERNVLRMSGTTMPTNVEALQPTSTLEGPWKERWQYLKEYLTKITGWTQTMVEKVQVDPYSGMAAYIGDSTDPGSMLTDCSSNDSGCYISYVGELIDWRDGAAKFQIMPGRRIELDGIKTTPPPRHPREKPEDPPGRGGPEDPPTDNPTDPEKPAEPPEREPIKPPMPISGPSLKHGARGYYKDRDNYPLHGVNLSKRKWNP